jgi:hypothetical protein
MVKQQVALLRAVLALLALEVLLAPQAVRMQGRVVQAVQAVQVAQAVQAVQEVLTQHLALLALQD